MNEIRRIVKPNGTVEWRLDDRIHREDGPAIEYTDGTKKWYWNGKLHRENGPAVEYPSGTKHWFLNGKCHRVVQASAVKHDSDKAARPELLPPEALMEISKVLAFGAKKYAEHNWRRGFAWTRLLGATLRHLFAWAGGEDRDTETGLSHLAHAGCCILFLLTLELTGTGQDDRYRDRGAG